MKPYINVVQNQDRTYNFSDLINEFTKEPPGPKKAPGPPPRFALNNIQILDGKSTSTTGRNKPHYLPRVYPGYKTVAGFGNFVVGTLYAVLDEQLGALCLLSI